MAAIPTRRLLASSAFAARTSAPSLSLRTAFSSKPHASWGPATRTSLKQRRVVCAPNTSVRWSTTSATGSKIWKFDEIRTLSSSPPSPSKSTTTPHPTLIDVREPSELQSTGRIPGAVNIPITTAPDSFHVSEAEFEDRFGFARPPPDAEVVFYCKAGVRSRAAAGIARDAGWKAVGEYPGSWIEWAGKGGEVQR